MDFEKYMNMLVPYATEYGLKIVVAILIFVVGKWIAKKIIKICDIALEKADVELTLKKFIENIIYYVLLIVILMASASALGIDTTAFLTILGTAGLAIGLALKDSLSNFAAGVMIILLKPFKVGDFVTAGGSTGSVKNISIFNTVLTTGDNQQILVPNGSIIGSTITNTNIYDQRRVDMTFGISYDDDISKAKTILTKILEDHPKVLKNPAYKIALSELADSSVNFIVRPWVKTADYWDVYFDVHESVKVIFDKENISMPYPQRDVHIYNENISS